MRLYTIPHRTYREIRDHARPGEIVLIPDVAYAIETWARILSFGHYLTRESRWTIRGKRRAQELGTIDVTAYSNVTRDPKEQVKNLLFLSRQNARRIGREFCGEAGLRWTP